MLASAVERDGRKGSMSTIVAVDLQQKIEFSVRGGNIEFFPGQDDDNETRRKLISKIFASNQLSQRLTYCMSLFLTCGEILWLILPKEDGTYLIDFFHGGATDPSPEYKISYAPGGRNIAQAIITYPYKNQGIDGYETERWVKLKITSDLIEQSDLAHKPDIKRGNLETIASDSTSKTIKYPNPFAPSIPAIVCPNNAKRSGQQGTSDYHWLKNQLENHEQMVEQIAGNLEYFGNPTLVTTRSGAEVTEAIAQTRGTATWASQNGFTDGWGDGYSSSTRVNNGNGHSSDRRRVGKVIGGVSEGERFGYIAPDPVTGDLNLFQRQQRELIHYALGGLDPLGISSGATAFEIKTLYGRVENTADLKADGLYTHGLALVFEQIIFFEEKKFKEELFEIFVELGLAEKYQIQSPENITDEIAQAAYRMAMEGQVKLPRMPKGLVPLGDRQVFWRYNRPVFKNSTRELLDLSIASRNAREDGLSQEYCMRLQHPEMTDKEIAKIVSGFSPRVVESASSAIGILAQLYQQFMSFPDPQNPKMPWGIRLGIAELLEQAMYTLNKELSYGQPEYDPANDTSPAINDPTIKLLLARRAADSSADRPNAPTPIEPGARSMAAYGLPATIDPAAIASRYSQNSGLSQGAGIANIPAPGSSVTAAGQSIFPNGNGATNSSFPSNIPPGISAEFAGRSPLWDLYSLIPGTNPASSAERPQGSGARKPAPRKRSRKKPTRNQTD